MRICHFANWGPRVSGMYESTKDQIKYERRAGHESDFVDAFEATPGAEKTDGWLTPITWEQAKGADIWVMHSKIPGEMQKAKGKTKIVAILHGPTEHMVWKGWATKEDLFNLHIGILWEYDATVCINVHEYDFMKLFDERIGRCHYIPNSVDLERFENITPWQYDYHPAIISCDTPRLEKIPFHIIFAANQVKESIPDAHLNIFSLNLEQIGSYRNLFCRSHKRHLEHICENIQLANRNLFPFQAGADIGFNNNISGIASRVTMEMMAFGVPVVSYGGDYTQYHAKVFDFHSIAEQIERVWVDLTKEGSTLKEYTRQYARDHFDRAKYVPQYIELYEKLLGA